MKNIFHVHELLHIIYDAKIPYSKEALKKEVEKRFGNNACFTSCADHQFNFDETVQFMLHKNKIEIKDDKIIPKQDIHICNHS